MRPTTEELEAFLHVADSESFTKAAQRLGLSKSVVSRRVRSLEDRLDTQLVSRTTHAVTLTALGAGFQERARRLLDDLDEAVDTVGVGAAAARGLVRMTAPTNLGTLHILPALTALTRKHAHLDVELDLNDRYVDVVGDGYDLAVRIGALGDTSLVARKLGTIERSVVCSPAYLARRGRPHVPADLQHHDCLTHINATAADQWRFMVDGAWQSVRTQSRLRTNNGEALLLAAINGMGLVGLPRFISADAVAAGQLVTVLDDFPMPAAALSALFPPSRRLTGRVRIVVEHLARYVRSQMP